MLEEYRHIPMVVMDWGEARADFTDSVIDNARLKAAIWQAVI